MNVSSNSPDEPRAETAPTQWARAAQPSESPVGASKKRLVKTCLAVLTITLLTVCTLLAFLFWPETKTFLTDADTIHEPKGECAAREILWQPPIPLDSPINADRDNYEPRLSADGLTLYFVRGKAGGGADIYFSLRTSAGWCEPTPLAEINTDFDDLGPEPSADGRSLYFYSDRSSGLGGYDLWVARRDFDDPAKFGEALNLGPAVNSPFNEYGPALTADGRTLYFASNRPCPNEVDPTPPDAWPGTLREDLQRRTYDLYVASLAGGGPTRAEALSALNTPFNEGAPAVSPSGDFLYFASDRPGGYGGYDLFRSRRLRGLMQPPLNLSTTVNSAANELDPGLSMGGYALHFSSDRPRAPFQPAIVNPYRLYHTASREVFAESETHARSENWGALWSAIGPHLLWALLSLTLLLLLLALMRDWRSRKISLLARCLAASLAVHALLILIFQMWEVSAGIAGEFRRNGGVRVSLTATLPGKDVSTLFQSTFTELGAASVASPAIARMEPKIEVALGDAVTTLPVEHRLLEFADASRLNPMERTTDAPMDSTMRPPRPAQAAIEKRLTSTVEVAMPSEVQRRQDTEYGRTPVAAPSPERFTDRPPVEVEQVSDDALAVVDVAPVSSRVTAESPVTFAIPVDLAHPTDADASSDSLLRRSPAAVQAASPTAIKVSLPQARQPSTNLEHEQEFSFAPVTPTVRQPAPFQPAATQAHALAAPMQEVPPERHRLPMADLDDGQWLVDRAPRDSTEALPILTIGTSANSRIDAPSSPSFEIELPKDFSPPPPIPYPQRSIEQRAAIVKSRGGSEETGRAVAQDVRWLVKGRVTNIATGAPLPGASVRLNLLHGSSVTALTDRNGQYRLSAPKVPDFFALSASHEGFVPTSANVSSATLPGTDIYVNFGLESASGSIVALETVPDVHHLGDDHFDGAINSQFQKQSEGRMFRAEFVLSAQQLPPRVTRASLLLMAKGAQTRPKLLINGSLLEQRLDDSPEDGRFGECAAEFAPDVLKPGVNTVEIIAGQRGTDIDDIEFVNLRIRLLP